MRPKDKPTTVRSIQSNKTKVQLQTEATSTSNTSFSSQSNTYRCRENSEINCLAIIPRNKQRTSSCEHVKSIASFQLSYNLSKYEQLKGVTNYRTMKREMKLPSNNKRRGPKENTNRMYAVQFTHNETTCRSCGISYILVRKKLDYAVANCRCRTIIWRQNNTENHGNTPSLNGIKISEK